MTASPKPYTATAVASRDSLTHRPQELATVIATEKANLEAQMARDGYRRTGAWKLSAFWAVGDDSTTPHGWKRTVQRKASARVVRIMATGVPK